MSRLALALGVALLAAGVGIILSAPDLSGFTLLGAVVFLLGLSLIHRVSSARELIDATEVEQL